VPAGSIIRISEVFTSSIISVIALMIEVAGASETSVNFYRTTRRDIQKTSHVHTRRRETLKSRIMIMLPARSMLVSYFIATF
jgi:hypothetical protein